MASLVLRAGLTRPFSTQKSLSTRVVRPQRQVVARPVLAAARPPAGEDQKPLHEKLAIPAAAVMAAALLFAATPDEALAARSGGRVGGSSGFSARRSAPPRSSGGGGTTINVAPPIVGGYGFGLPMFGGYGYGFSPFGFGMPIFGFGTFFNIMLLLIAMNVVLSVVRNFTNGSKRPNDSDDEPW